MTSIALMAPWGKKYCIPPWMVLFLAVSWTLVWLPGCNSHRDSVSKFILPDSLKPDIVITSVGDSCFVQPSPYHTGTKGYVILQAKGSDVTVHFPELGLTPVRWVELKDGEAVFVTIRPYTVPGMRYRYSVFSKNARHYGIGKSEPEMIVP